jgi:hypothetical protein
MEVIVPVNPELRQRGGRPARHALCSALYAATFVLMLTTGAIAGMPRAAIAAAPEARASALPSATPVRLIAGVIATRGAHRPTARIIDRLLAQNADTDSNSEIAPGQVEKYIAVYKDMQHDRSLTVEQAATKEGFSISAFRDLEQKIERDEPIREHVRDELQSAAPSAPTPATAK